MIFSKSYMIYSFLKKNIKKHIRGSHAEPRDKTPCKIFFFKNISKSFRGKINQDGNWRVGCSSWNWNKLGEVMKLSASCVEERTTNWITPHRRNNWSTQMHQWYRNENSFFLNFLVIWCEFYKMFTIFLYFHFKWYYNELNNHLSVSLPVSPDSSISHPYIFEVIYNM